MTRSPFIPATSAETKTGNPAEVLTAFLKLGLTSFGGPVAHLGYFHREFVEQRRWLGEAEFADLVALCQFLPGPASSQVGFGIGLRRAGFLGALAAWTGFTLPSALAMTGFALAQAALTGRLARGAVHGLQLVAVAVVAQAVLGMARSLAPDRPRAGIALGALLLATLAGAGIGQLAAIGLGALAGLVLCRAETIAAPNRELAIGRATGLAALGTYLALLIGLPLLAALIRAPALEQFDAFYRSGALVFGGGHVVLPLLQQAVVPHWVPEDRFLAGYGAAQAMPGPLFTFAAFLGASMGGPAGAALGLVAIFLPGLLLLLAALPFWHWLRRHRTAQAALAGANAAVVGILAAALYQPVWTGAVRGPGDFAVAAAGFVLLTAFKAPPIAIVALGLAGGMAQAAGWR
jgi:chromate transporter